MQEEKQKMKDGLHGSNIQAMQAETSDPAELVALGQFKLELDWVAGTNF